MSDDPRDDNTPHPGSEPDPIPTPADVASRLRQWGVAVEDAAGLAAHCDLATVSAEAGRRLGQGESPRRVEATLAAAGVDRKVAEAVVDHVLEHPCVTHRNADPAPAPPPLFRSGWLEESLIAHWRMFVAGVVMCGVILLFLGVGLLIKWAIVGLLGLVVAG